MLKFNVQKLLLLILITALQPSSFASLLDGFTSNDIYFAQCGRNFQSQFTICDNNLYYEYGFKSNFRLESDDESSADSPVSLSGKLSGGYEQTSSSEISAFQDTHTSIASSSDRTMRFSGEFVGTFADSTTQNYTLSFTIDDIAKPARTISEGVITIIRKSDNYEQKLPITNVYEQLGATFP